MYCHGGGTHKKQPNEIGLECIAMAVAHLTNNLSDGARMYCHGRGTLIKQPNEMGLECTAMMVALLTNNVMRWGWNVLSWCWHT